jgi:RNase P subunit RPR2
VIRSNQTEINKESLMNACESCQRSLAGAELTLPWEDGNNPYAYATCPSCGHHTTMYGFGEDD